MDNLINNFSVKTATDFFFHKFDSFSEDLDDLSYLLKDENFSLLEKIGEAKLENAEDIIMFTCKSEFDLTERSSKKSQYEIAKAVMRQEVMDSAIGIFYDRKGNFRFSFVRTNYGNKEEKFSTWKRFTYFVTKDQTNKTFRQRINEADFSSIDKIQKAFSVESLTKQFYEELFAWYLWALSEEDGFSVKYPNDTSFDDDNRKIEEHLIRLITRLIFVWFIRRKKLVPDSIFNLDELKNILVTFDPESKDDGNYYNAILQNLFFACLNNPIEARAFSTEDSFKGIAKDFGVKNLFRDNKKSTWFKIPKNEVVDIFKQVPFLNGGLFECLDKIRTNEKGKDDVLYYDGFSRDEKTKDGHLKRAFVPNALFFDSKKGIITILEKYNFTVEENSVDDVEVALDPELLGKVFENLLAAYNPETKETARKQTGSFYTPREIVDFMVDQSLIQYLVTHNEDISKEDLEEFVLKKTLPESFTPKKIEEVTKQIKNIKILDPACGSGAYPMGILSRLFEMLTLLGGNSENHYENKLTLIENCIFGVDIQSIAVQISKLRFFISLIVEQSPNNNAAENYGIRSLPNLETKFVAANTLIGLKQHSKDQLDFNDRTLIELKNQLWDLRNHQNFNARSFEEKKRLRKKDKELCEKIKLYIHANTSQPNEERIAENLKQIEILENKIKNLPVQMVDVTQSFTQTSMFEDDVVSTPSMFRKDANEEERTKLKRQVNGLKKEIDFERSKKGAVDTEEADNLISWDPYDQNHSAPFFDPEWMFGVEQFDVVIGNPPYIQLQKDGGKLAKTYENCGFRTFARTGDIYSLFYEKGWQLLKDKGNLCYITSNKWMRAGYGESTRSFFAKETNPIILIDFSGQKIFEAATVDTNILLFTKSKNQNNTISCTVKEKVLNKLSDYFEQNFSICGFSDSNAWTILTKIEKRIKDKVESVGVPLKNWKININYGIKTGYNEAFIIDKQKKDEIVKKDPKSAHIIRPILRGRDIRRYGYDYSDLWLINTHNGLKEKGIKPVDINDFPAIKEHLDQYLPHLKKRADKGISYYNLRNCAYIEDFNHQKIMYPNITQFLPFYLDSKGFYQNDKAFMITGKFIHFLCAFLNSNLFKYCFIDNFPKLGEKGREIRKIFLEKIPVLLVDEKVNKKFEKLIMEVQSQKMSGIDTKELENKIDEEIFDLYSLTDMEKNEICSKKFQ